jgi:hypothetical protein
MDMVADIDPIPHFLLHNLLLFFGTDLFVFLESENSVLLFEDWVGRRIESIQRVLLQGTPVDCLAA